MPKSELRKEKPPKHHAHPPHIDAEIGHLKEKVARLEGRVDVILNILSKKS